MANRPHDDRVGRSFKNAARLNLAATAAAPKRSFRTAATNPAEPRGKKTSVAPKDPGMLDRWI